MTKEKLIRYGKDYLHDLETACCPISDIHKEFVREAIKALEIVEEFEKAQIITGGRLNGRTYAYKCGLEDGKRKALEQQKPLEKFENVKDHICKLASDYKCWDNRLSHEESLELCNILEQQPCCNCIEFKRYAKQMGFEIKKSEEKTSDDCVSRQAVIEYIKDCDAELMHDSENESVREDIMDMPPVTPTFPKGATNGDMIKAMFNCMVIDITDGKVYVEKIYFPFDEDWWNAPYKRGAENG